MERAIERLLGQLDWSDRELSDPPLFYLDKPLAESLPEQASILVEFTMPAGPLFRGAADGVVAIERRTRLAAILAFGPEEQIRRVANAEELLQQVPDLPLRLAALGMGSPIKITIEAEDEALREGVHIKLGGKPPEATQLTRERARGIRRFMKAMFHLFAATEIAFTLSVTGTEIQPPQQAQTPPAIVSMANRACGLVPPGTGFEIKVGPIGLKGKCPPAARRDDSGV